MHDISFSWLHIKRKLFLFRETVSKESYLQACLQTKRYQTIKLEVYLPGTQVDDFQIEKEDEWELGEAERGLPGS
jgi:hypothetical protein